MSRKNPSSSWGRCPTCGGAEVITVRGRGIARVMSNRYPYTPAQQNELRRIREKWEPALYSTHAWHDADDTYHDPDLISTRLVVTALKAEQAEVGSEDRSRRSIRVYWPTKKGFQYTLAMCPDSFHKNAWWRQNERIERERDAAAEPPSSKPRLSFTAPASERRAQASARRKAKARRHKERQAKR